MVVSRGRILKAGGLEYYVHLAAEQRQHPGGLLILIDSDDDCASRLGPDLQQRAIRTRPDLPLAVVLAVREFLRRSGAGLEQASQFCGREIAAARGRRSGNSPCACSSRGRIATPLFVVARRSHGPGVRDAIAVCHAPLSAS